MISEVRAGGIDIDDMDSFVLLFIRKSLGKVSSFGSFGAEVVSIFAGRPRPLILLGMKVMVAFSARVWLSLLTRDLVFLTTGSSTMATGILMSLRR